MVFGNIESVSVMTNIVKDSVMTNPELFKIFFA